MATINLSAITLPAKSAWPNIPGKDTYNQEKFYGVLLDLLALAKTNGFTWTDQGPLDLSAKMDTLIDVVHMLAFQNVALELGDVTIRFMHNTVSLETV